jgi:hypothetical protein
VPSPEEITAVRFKVGDVDSEAPLLGDEEIGAALEAEGSTEGAAAACADSLARRFALQADVHTGDLRLIYSRQSEVLAKLALELRKRVTAGSGPPFAGGISNADKEARVEDKDRTPGSFRRGQFDAPGRR